MNFYILILVLTLSIYKFTGLYNVSAFIISAVNLIISTRFIEENPEDIIYRIINFLSLIIILIILIFNILILFSKIT